MRKRIVTTLTLAITLALPTAIFAANPKPGSSCTKQGSSQNYLGKKFTCIRSGTKLIWNKGILIKTISINPSPNSGFAAQPTPVPTPLPSSTPLPINTPTPSPTSSPLTVDWSRTYSTDDGYKNLFNGPCQKEEMIASQWEELQKAYINYANCSGIYNVAKYVLGNQIPKTNLPSLTTVSVNQCKLTEPRDSMSLRGFYSDWEPGRINWTEFHSYPSRKMVIQIIPIYSDDTSKPVNTPEADYKRYTDFIKDWVEYSSDQVSFVEIRFPQSYLKFSGNLSSYGIYHENRHDNPQHVKFNNDLISQVDPYINFSGVNVAIIVTPSGTPLNVLQQGSIGELVTAEGRVPVSTTEYPYTLQNLSSVKFSNFLVPFWWLHEMFHSGIGFQDHYGDDQHNVNTEYGLGWWTLMTPWGGDLSAWEKWILGFYSDNQINCLVPNSSNITWLVPSSVKSTGKKLTVIPISRNKGIVIESIRAAGLYYKIPSSSQGVLVYEIDLTVKMGDAGLKLVLPTNRDPNRGPFFLAEATLRQGESVLSNGHRITVLESGNFGDVVKVEVA